MNILIDALKNSILITGLVMIMMLLIEYINIHSHGATFKKLKKSPVKQVILAALLGLVPGCVGGFAVVSLYTHNLLSFGSLVAMMIASSGDEAFLLMAMIPKTAIILFVVLFVIGIAAGILVDKIYKGGKRPFSPEHYQLHEECCEEKKTQEDTHTHTQAHNHTVFGTENGKTPRKWSKERLSIMAGIAIFIVAVVFGLLEHEHSAENSLAHESHGTEISMAPNDGHAGEIHCTEGLNAKFDIFRERWINLTFAGVSLITLILTARANEHFIKEHLWNHVIRKHFRSIFLWTTGALLVIHFGIQFLDIESWVKENVMWMILLAVLIGFIPESGPHMIFITLFIGGFVPFSVLLASSIAQDGHTALPLLAESKMSFFLAKAINIVLGFVIGIGVHLAGF